MKINIKGPIISNNDQWIYDWFGIEAVSPQKVSTALSKVQDNEDIVIEINSGGGSVYDASEIYATLKDHPAHVTGKILGIAASAASVIAMASDKLVMAPTGQMMIHNAKTRSEGDYRDMAHTSEFLQNVNQTIANAYKLKSGKEYDELLAMMNKETWLTPQQAKEHHLIDEVMFENEAPNLVANLPNGGMLPQEVIDKMRNNPNQINAISQTVATMEPVTPINQKEEPQPMNMEQLKNDYPELYNQIKNEGKTEGIQAENARIKAIEDLALPGNEALINDAKFKTMDTAETLAINIIKAEKERGQNYLNNLQSDAQPLNNVKGNEAPPPTNDSGDKELGMIQNVWGGNNQ